ncbi:putative monocarboxylate transporter 10, partial [Sesbania bispinosa]
MGAHGGVAAGKGSSATEAQPRGGGESRARIGWCRLRGAAAALPPARKGTKPRDGGERWLAHSLKKYNRYCGVVEGKEGASGGSR